jgi:hypothetical protein
LYPKEIENAEQLGYKIGGVPEWVRAIQNSAQDMQFKPAVSPLELRSGGTRSVNRLSSRKAMFGAAGALALAGLGLFADWRDWIDWPDLLSVNYSRFDKFYINGKAPWCLLLSSDYEFAKCHYLSKEHCQQANYLIMTHGDPDERGVCVPSPLK